MTLHFPQLVELTIFTFTWNLLTQLNVGKFQEHNIQNGGLL